MQEKRLCGKIGALGNSNTDSNHIMSTTLARATLTVSKLPHAEHSGDWHDKPLRWIVSDGIECQKFSTKTAALNFASRWRKSATMWEAIAKY